MSSLRDRLDRASGEMTRARRQPRRAGRATPLRQLVATSDASSTPDGTAIASAPGRRHRRRPTTSRVRAPSEADLSVGRRRALAATRHTPDRGAQAHGAPELLEQLGPKLYDADSTRPSSSSRSGRPCRRCSRPGARRSPAPTGPGSPRRSPTTSSATARSSRSCATRTSPRSWSTAPTRSTSSAAASSTPVDAPFTDESHLRRTIDKIVARVGRRVDESSPMVDARLPDGSRVNAVIPPLALDGSAAHDPQVLRRPATRSTT